MRASERIDLSLVGASYPAWQLEGFVEAYQEVFSGPPYGEEYTREQVIDEAWAPNHESGIVVLAHVGERVIGFGCSIPVLCAPSDSGVIEHLHSLPGLPFALESTWYMSDFGVRPAYERRGIGLDLIEARIRYLRGLRITHYVMRTAAANSNSIEMYKRIGAIELPGRHDVSASGQVTVNKSQSTERIYLWGTREGALVGIANERQRRSRTERCIE